jgi:hypothetical protein
MPPNLSLCIELTQEQYHWLAKTTGKLVYGYTPTLTFLSLRFVHKSILCEASFTTPTYLLNTYSTAKTTGKLVYGYTTHTSCYNFFVTHL